MKLKKTFIPVLLAAGLAVPAGAMAKTLVHCSEGSPEGFDPALYTAGTTFDASSHPLSDKRVIKLTTKRVVFFIKRSSEKPSK